VADVSGAASLSLTEDDYWVVWGVDGGLEWAPSIDLEGGGDLLTYMLRRSSLRIDEGRLASARSVLNRYKFAGYIDEGVSPYAWLADNLLPLLPVSMRSGPDGLYPIVWDMDATAADAVAVLVAGEQVERVGGITYDRTARDVVNELRFDFAQRARTQNYKRSRTLTPKPETADADTFSNIYAEVSYRRYGLRSGSLQSEIVYRQATADAILAWRLRAYGFVHRLVSYVGGVDLAWLSPGDVVDLTDSDLSLTNEVALVQATSLGGDGVVALRLLIVEDVARMVRAT